MEFCQTLSANAKTSRNMNTAIIKSYETTCPLEFLNSGIFYHHLPAAVFNNYAPACQIEIAFVQICIKCAVNAFKFRELGILIPQINVIGINCGIPVNFPGPFCAVPRAVNSAYYACNLIAFCLQPELL